METLKATGRNVNGWDFGSEIAPEFIGKSAGYNGLVTLPDGRKGYVPISGVEHDNATGGHLPIFAEMVGQDHGGNIHRRAIADNGDSLQGISAPIATIPCVKRGEKLIGWLKE